MIAAAGVWFELALLCSGGLALFMRWGYTAAEAGIYAVMTVLMSLSLVLQICFLFGIPDFAIVLEIIMMLAAGCLVFRHRALLTGVGRRVRQSARGRLPLVGSLALCLMYLAGQCFLIPPTVNHWPELANLLWYPKTTLLDLSEPLPGRVYLRPLNLSVLPYLFLRIPTDFGVAGIGALGYLAIAFGTYALARRHAWPSTAVTVALIVVSLPRLVLQASTPGLEIIPAAVSLLCVLCIYRLIEQSSIRDFILLWLGLLFSASSGYLSLGMAAILFIVAVVLLLRRHAAVFWWGLIRRSWRPVLAALPPAFLFSQIWLLAYRRATTGAWFDASGPGGFVFNRDGLPGALDNAIRYLLGSFDLTQIAEQVGRRSFGFSPTKLIEDVYHTLTTLVLGNRAAVAPFSEAWVPSEMLSWFGPLAVFLILPAVVFAAWRGTRRLKVIGIALIGYFYLVALIPAWTPGNAALFTSWFACGGYLVAFLLPPWRISHNGLVVLRSICIVLIAYALLFNVSKPAFGKRLFQAAGPAVQVLKSASDSLLFPDSIANSIWVSSDWGMDRWLRARRLFGDDRVERCSILLDTNARVGMLVKVSALSYPFLAERPDVDFRLIDPETFNDTARLQRLQLKYVLFVDTAPSAAPAEMTNTRIWEADPAVARFPGALIRLGR